MSQKLPSQDVKRVMAIDPGTDYVGVCLAEVTGSDLTSLTASTMLASDSKMGIDKLIHLADKLLMAVRDFAPDYVVIEDYGFGSNFFNVHVAELVGILLFRLSRRGKCTICQLAPNTVKFHITGKGKASKKDVAEKVDELYGISGMSHASDAVAVFHTFRKYLCGELSEEDSRMIS